MSYLLVFGVMGGCVHNGKANVFFMCQTCFWWDSCGVEGECTMGKWIL